MDIFIWALSLSALGYTTFVWLDTCPDIYRDFIRRNFLFQKSYRRFSKMALDQVYKQNNEKTKGVSAATQLQHDIVKISNVSQVNDHQVYLTLQASLVNGETQFTKFLNDWLKNRIIAISSPFKDIMKTKMKNWRSKKTNWNTPFLHWQSWEKQYVSENINLLSYFQLRYLVCHNVLQKILILVNMEQNLTF